MRASSKGLAACTGRRQAAGGRARQWGRRRPAAAAGGRRRSAWSSSSTLVGPRTHGERGSSTSAKDAHAGARLALYAQPRLAATATCAGKKQPGSLYLARTRSRHPPYLIWLLSMAACRRGWGVATRHCPLVSGQAGARPSRSKSMPVICPIVRPTVQLNSVMERLPSCAQRARWRAPGAATGCRTPGPAGVHNYHRVACPR